METMTFRAWSPASDYGPVTDALFEDLWQPRLGPTPTALLRLAHRMFAEHADTVFTTTDTYLADALGVREAMLRRTMDRLCRIGQTGGAFAARPAGAPTNTWLLRTSYPLPDRVPLTQRARLMATQHAETLRNWPGATRDVERAFVALMREGVQA